LGGLGKLAGLDADIQAMAETLSAGFGQFPRFPLKLGRQGLLWDDVQALPGKAVWRVIENASINGASAAQVLPEPVGAWRMTDFPW